jgi:hypothetical protein
MKGILGHERVLESELHVGVFIIGWSVYSGHF